jgi:PAS domain S-box-containing protein
MLGSCSTFLVSALIPPGNSAALVFPRDLLPLALAATFLMAAWGLFRRRPSSLVAEARERWFEGSSDIVVVLDAQDRVADLNPAAQQIIGRTTADILGQPLAQVCSAWPELVKLVRDGKRPRQEITLQGEDGPSHLEVSLTNLGDRPDNPAGRLLVLRDVTEQKQAADLLREKGHRLEQAVEVLEAVTKGTEVMVAALDLEFRYVFFNEAYHKEIRQLTGKDIKIGSNMIDTFADLPEQQAVSVSQWSRTLHGASAKYRIEFGDPEQSRRVYSVRRTPLWDAQGNVIGAGEISFDITERMQAEKALADSERHYHRLFDTMLQGVVYQDAEGTIISMNPAAERILGKSQAEFLGQSSVSVEHDTLREDGSPFPGLEHPAMVALRTGREVRDVHMQVYNPREQQYRWISITAMPLFHEGESTPYQVYTIFHDITERKRAEAEVEEGKRILEALMESVPEGITIATAPDGKVRKVSRRGQELLGRSPVGLTPGQVITQWKAYYPDGIRQMVAADLPVARAIHRGETLRDVELVLVSSAGQRLLLSCNAAPIYDREGTITGGVVAWRDVSELKEAERRHSRILASALNGFSLVDTQGKFLEVNDAFCQMMGYSRSELLAMHVADIEAIDDWAAVERRIATLQENGYDRFETRHRRRDGAMIDVEVSTTYHRTGGGQIANFIQDISARKRAEEMLQRAHDELEQQVQKRTAELQASEERFRQLAENIDEVFWLLEPDTWQMLYVSPAFDAIFGRSLQELAVHPQSFLDTIHPDDRERVVHDLTANWQAYDGEFRILRPDGTPRWIQLRSFPVCNEKGEVYRVAGIAVDRTDQRATETALIQAERLTIAGKLAASLAHEINNPLQSVIGCLGLLQGALENDRDPGSYLQVARQEVKRTALIVSQLRSLGQPIQDGHKEPTGLNDLLNNVLVLNKVHLQTHKIQVIWEPDTKVPLLPLMPGPVRQVFLNLVINAADAMPDGGQLRLSTTHTISPDGVRVVVADTGTGIPPDVLPHVFEAFYSTKSEGLGVGLFLSQSIVQAHGGRIEVESKPAVGTTFTVWLPA